MSLNGSLDTPSSSPLEAQQLSGGYDDKRIIEAVNLTLVRGEWLSLVGANGSGKSTLLRLLSRILPTQAGAVLLNGKAIHTLPSAEVAKQMALLPQQQVLPAGLTVQQLVSLGRTPHQPWWQWDLDAKSLEKVAIALAWTEMESYRDRPVSELSGGERQRAFLALALAQDPQVLLLDEPTTFLDIHYQLQLLELLKRLNQQQGLSIITVLHDINLAARYSDRIACLRHGKLWAVGSVPSMLTPKIMREVFDVDAAILDTPVGLQICPLAASQTATAPSIPDLQIPNQISDPQIPGPQNQIDSSKSPTYADPSYADQ
ncbi:ABC transporter ATP-binding protein [cf. Phormidesmis sp. LEGE 11477]|uniref:ABC transporter ATP-binding protein n=1 Tax=cf. Phormidesmis sp. LEGE 11477 TaxID=1828680 RepID=UPI00188162AD|nr:ABC transporter ATP-binding protein [cf. Phormidesmis sp. LEGE 11477]MBE9064773.1 ABC transporter ATP-binding protein [cf. Phormidesmis sp. LEGE 11477]